MAVSRDQVIGLYQEVLGRNPYDAELAPGGWVDKHARSGLSVDQLRSEFQNSDEAKSRQAPAAAPSTAAMPATGGNILDPYIEAASKLINPGYDEAATAVKTAGEQSKSAYDKLAEQTLSREPLIRQTYANLSAEFSASEDREMKVANRIGEQNIGAATAAVAATGTENAQGAFRAPITKEQNALLANIAEIADKYNLKQETLTAEMNSSLQDLYDKASAYTLQGQTEMSKALVDMAKLKIDQKKDILAQAQQMFGNDLEVKKLEEQIKNDERQYKLEVDKFAYQKEQDAKQLALGYAQLAQSRANSTKSESKAAAKAYKYEPQKDAEGNVTGFDFYDDRGIPVGPLEYFAAKGDGTIDVTDMEKVFRSSSNPGDQEIATAISLMRSTGLSNGAIGKAIESKYPYLKG